MRYKTIKIIILALLILHSYSCRKGSIETNYNPVLQAANNQAIAEQAYADVFRIFYQVIKDTTLKNSGSNTVFGALCTYQDTSGIEYRIDYGMFFNACPDGKSRKGTITASLDKDISEINATATLHFSAYGVRHTQELALYGDNTIINAGISSEIQQVFEHHIPSATIAIVDSLGQDTYEWESEKIFTMNEGMETPGDFGDDIFTITGTSTGSDISGNDFSTSIEEALAYYFNCSWIRTGITNLYTPSLDIGSGYIDYIGQDTCTNQVVYYFNGNPFYDSF